MKNFNPADDKPARYYIPDVLCPRCKNAMRERKKEKTWKCVRCGFIVKADNFYSCKNS